MNADYTKLVPLPARGDINSGLSFCHPRTCETILGAPALHLTAVCEDPTGTKLRRHLSKANVGPFEVRGLTPALESLKRIFEQVLHEHPHLYEQVGTAGMLCCRLIRGTTHTPSNHSWGCAIDLKIGGKLVPLGSRVTLQGLLSLYPYFHAEKWYWGAGFSRSDSPHFECSDELMREWHDKGLI